MTAPLDSRDTARQTFVEEGSAFHGTFDSTCPIVVSGSIRGSVTAPEVTIDPLGAIVGAIKADRLTSAGTLSGTVDAVHVLLSGSVRSDTVIRAEQLDVSLRAVHGRLQLTFGPREAEAEAVPSVDLDAAPSAEVETASAELEASSAAAEAAPSAAAEAAPSAAAEAAPSAAAEAAPSAAAEAAPSAEAETAASAELDDDAELDSDVAVDPSTAADAELGGAPSSEATLGANKSAGRRARRAQRKPGRG
jgi:cytoskeletal protein CcmA (bactofilin family)